MAANKVGNATDQKSTAVSLGQRPGKPGSFYVPQLDALRFLAFLLVFLSHGLNPETYVTQFSPSTIGLMALIRDSCGFGLCLFFFLSSFLITSLLSIEKKQTGDINLYKFYVRRILRIWPLYFLYIGAVALVGVRLKTWHISVPRLIAMSLLAGNWYAIAAGIGNSAIAALWSISVEEQFYAIWPSIFRVLEGRRFVIFAGAVGLSSLVATFLIASRSLSSLAVWLNSLPQCLFFASGALLARLTSQRTRSLALSCVFIAGGLAVWVIAEKIGIVANRTAAIHPSTITLGYALVACGCVALLEGFLRFPADLVPRWVIYLGKISYGLYVFHGLANHSYPYLIGPRLNHILCGNMLITLPITLACAALSYSFIEKPFLQLKERFELITTRPA